MAKVKSNIDLGKVPISAKAKKGMTLTGDDQQWLKRLLDLQSDSFNDAFDVNVTELTKALAETINESNLKMFSILDDQNKSIARIEVNVGKVMDRLSEIEKRLDGIETNLTDKEIRLILLEQYMSMKYTLVRGLIAIAVGLGLGFLIHHKLTP
jgi:hypothetical protein